MRIARDLGTEVEIVGGLGQDERIVANPPDSIGDGEEVRVTEAAGEKTTGRPPSNVWRGRRRNRGPPRWRERGGTRRMKWRPWLAAPIALALGGCDFAPRYAPPSVAVPYKFKDEAAGGGTLPASGEWWLAFNDRTLDNLQAQVDAANPNLAAAIAANDAAVARANAALSCAYPQVDADPHFLANKQSANRPLRSPTSRSTTATTSSARKRPMRSTSGAGCAISSNSANATAEASAAALADARLELHAELARDYVNLRGFDDETKLFADTIGIYRSALKLTQDRLAAQIASPVDVDRAQTQLSSAEAQASDLRSIGRARKFHRRAGRQGRCLILDLTVLRGPRRPDRRARFRPTCCATVQTSQKANG